MSHITLVVFLAYALAAPVFASEPIMFKGSERKEDILRIEVQLPANAGYVRESLRLSLKDLQLPEGADGARVFIAPPDGSMPSPSSAFLIGSVGIPKSKGHVAGHSTSGSLSLGPALERVGQIRSADSLAKGSLELLVQPYASTSAPRGAPKVGRASVNVETPL